VRCDVLTTPGLALVMPVMKEGKTHRWAAERSERRSSEDAKANAVDVI